MFLIDTDILIYSLKSHPEVTSNFEKHNLLPKSISVITYGEMLYGARKSQRPVQSLAVVYKMAELFPILEITKPIMEIFSEIKSKLDKTGNHIDDMDLLIAATALTGNYTLVTNNESHFSRISGLHIDNWSRGIK